MESDSAGLYRRGFEPEVRCFEIAAIANDHVEKFNAIILTHNAVQVTGKTLLAALARMNEAIHAATVRKEHAMAGN